CVAAIALLSALVVAWPLVLSAQAVVGLAGLLLFVVLALGPASDVAVALTNLGAVQQIGPRPLAKLELRDGVPPDLRALLVVPVLLTGDAQVEELVAQLEVHYLANPDEELRFALLSDWTDDPAETRADDERLVAAAAAGIAPLNEPHGHPPHRPRFFLFHPAPPRNQREGRWI